jgi:hypothetical protein
VLVAKAIPERGEYLSVSARIPEWALHVEEHSDIETELVNHPLRQSAKYRLRLIQLVARNKNAPLGTAEQVLSTTWVSRFVTDPASGPVVTSSINSSIDGGWARAADSNSSAVIKPSWFVPPTTIPCNAAETSAATGLGTILSINAGRNGAGRRPLRSASFNAPRSADESARRPFITIRRR